MIVALLAREFEVAKAKYFSEHRKLLPEQVHRTVLIRRDIDTSWA